MHPLTTDVYVVREGSGTLAGMAKFRDNFCLRTTVDAVSRRWVVIYIRHRHLLCFERIAAITPAVNAGRLLTAALEERGVDLSNLQ